VSQNHDDIAARLRDEASATAPERLRADVMLRVRAEPRPQRIQPRRRSLGRSFATLAAAACILGSLVLGLSRVDFGGNGSAAGGGSSAAGGAQRAAAPSSVLGDKRAMHLRSTYSPTPQGSGAVTNRADALEALTASGVPRPLRAAIYPRFQLATPLRQAFGALDPHARPIPR
jgi:hypothetical protein